jgi:hypothetical protein
LPDQIEYERDYPKEAGQAKCGVMVNLRKWLKWLRFFAGPRAAEY